MLIISNQGTDPVDIVTTAGETASIGAGGHISLSSWATASPCCRMA